MTADSVNERKLIQLVEERPFLYDVSHKDYKNKNEKQKGWQSIADEIQNTAERCEFTWKSLRKQYTDYRRRLRLKGDPTGTGVDDTLHFRYSEEMKFYESFYRPYNSSFTGSVATDSINEQKLILLVGEKVFLYDKSLKDYKNKIKKQKGWQSIAKELQSSAEQCQNIWERLRKQYTGYLRRLKNNSIDPGVDDVLYFRYSEAMKFYEPFYRPYKTNTHLNSVDEEDTRSSLDLSGDNESSLCDGIEIKLEDLQEENAYQKFEIHSTPTNIRDQGSSSQKRKMNIDIKDISIQGEPDEFMLFCSCLAPKIRRIHVKNPIRAAQLQIDIQQLILKAEMDTS